MGYSDDITTEDEEGINLALEWRDRVRSSPPSDVCSESAEARYCDWGEY